MKLSGVAVANLLRMARGECRCTVAFAAISPQNGPAEMFTFPATGTAANLSQEVIGELVSQASRDPEFGHAGVFVRSVQLDEPLTLAVAPLHGIAATGMIGVIGQDEQGFDQQQLELLDRLAERLARHVRAVDRIESMPSGAEPRTEDGIDGHLVRAPSGPGEGNGATTFGSSGAPAGGVAVTATQGPLPSPSRPAVPAPGEAVPSRSGGPAPAPAVAFTEPAGEGEGEPGASNQPGLPGAQPVAQGPATVWGAIDPLTGLASQAQFFSRAGRLIGSEARATSALAVVLVEVPDERTAPQAARALSAQLRFSDPLARIDRNLFAAAVLLFPGSTRGDAVEERLGAAARAALDWLAPVRTTHVLAEPGDRRDIDELLRQALSALGSR